MASPKLPVRRRRRSEYELGDEEDNEAGADRRVSTASVSSKRARGSSGRRSLPSSSPEPVLPDGYRSRPHKGRGAAHHEHNSVDGPAGGSGQHQPGAILRVKVINFVTYEEAVFYPGPNLNMVIGPNGTGKSSLVCAICLGLGYGPNHLGRAGKVGEFVKHGKDDATIEIELQRSLGDTNNPIVRVRIIRDGDKRKWWINDSETSLKNVQGLTRKFGIQVDNLCQFLPQDRVSEFAGLNPVELLHETQRAAAPEEMLVFHDDLKRLRKDQKALELQHQVDQEHLTNSLQRQEGLRADVERLQERAQVQNRIALLERSIPFLEYKKARNQFNEAKARRREASSRLKDLERQVEPTMLEVNAKEEYQSQIDAVVKERKTAVKEAERAADLALTKVKDAEERVIQAEQTRKAELDGDKKRKQDLQQILNKIRNLEVRLQETPPEFNSEDFNRRIRQKEHRVREIETQGRELGGQIRELRQQGEIIRRQFEAAEQQLASLDSQAGKQVSKLKKLSNDTAQAWEWIQNNRQLFEHTVYGPPLVECSIKDLRYVDQIESIFSRSGFTAFTVQSKSDYLKLQNYLYGGELKLADVQINVASKPLEVARRVNVPVLSEQQMQQLGLDGWALDYIDGPEPVLSMLCSSVKAHATGIAHQETTEAQYALLLDSPVQSWVAGKHSYQTSRRREYGAGAVSTTTKNVKQAEHWTDQAVDGSEKRELQESIDGWKEEFNALKQEVQPLLEKTSGLKAERVEANEEVTTLKEEKNRLQTALGQFNALPAKLEREKESLEQKQQQGVKLRQRLQELSAEQDILVLKKATLALEHKNQIASLRKCHEDYLEAEIRLVEASSDVEALKHRNIDISQKLEDERRLERQATTESDEAKKIASKALAVCKSILEEDDGNNDHYRSISDTDMTMDQLEHEIDAERAKLDFIHGGNTGALKEFEMRKISIEKLEEKVAETDKKLQRLSRKIASLREMWEPELDRLVKEISDAFAYNFEQIGCAGEVGVHKDEDFDLWAIQIKVKFREHETLQLLDQHRQSGGERSVSTIFYLMALQSLARAPFRVVDEINQGMDPRNERMVHERMVEIACKEHTSQYFLITPKLLTGLKYDPRMKVLCIASGEYMPNDHTQLDITRAIHLKRRAVAAV